MVIIGNFAIIHRGYLDIIEKYPDARIYILSEKLAGKLYKNSADLRKLPTQAAQNFLSNLNRPINIMEEEDIPFIKQAAKIIFIDDSVVEELKKRYFAYHPNIITETGFYYHDQKNVYSQDLAVNLTKNYTDQDVEIMKNAILLANDSGCFWRQVASIIVKERQILYKAYNQMLPNKDECYKIGCIRDDLKPGEKTAELCSAIHSEANCIAQAAKDGVSLAKASLYVTVFPCPMCAKLIALSGISKCYYHTGWANFDGERVMQSAGVELIKIDL